MKLQPGTSQKHSHRTVQKELNNFRIYYWVIKYMMNSQHAPNGRRTLNFFTDYGIEICTPFFRQEALIFIMASLQ
jgi:hypothetical protein